MARISSGGPTAVLVPVQQVVVIVVSKPSPSESHTSNTPL